MNKQYNIDKKYNLEFIKYNDILVIVFNQNPQNRDFDLQIIKYLS